MSLTNFVKRVRDIMRNDAGINGDAQRIEQMAWMLFLKVYDEKENDWDMDEANYLSIIPEPCRWRKPRKYTDEFKQQLVELYRSGKRRCDICREYDIATSLFDKWVKQASNSGSFHEKDNRTPEQEELIRLRKENQQLRMENDILKQAALILGRK